MRRGNPIAPREPGAGTTDATVRFIPEYEVSERHETRVAAPASVTYAAACELALERSAMIRAVFRTREILLRTPRPQRALPSGLLPQMLKLGWGTLAEEPGRELVMGAVTRPWEAQVTFHSVQPNRFAAFDAPGFVQIAWTVSAHPIDERTSLLRTITRVRTTDALSRERFRGTGCERRTNGSSRVRHSTPS